MPQTDSSVVTLAEGPSRAPLTTPTGLQPSRPCVVAASWCSGSISPPSQASRRPSGGCWRRTGVDGLDLALLACGLATLPWTVLGFWNAAIGFVLLRSGDRACSPPLPTRRQGRRMSRSIVTTAVVMTLRNEDPARALSRLALVRESLERTGQGAAFRYHVLSDSDDPGVIAAEEAWVASWRAGLPEGEAAGIHYRRRRDNAGYKAGNLQEFCARSDAELMLPLDADSLMTGPAILRLVRIMQAHPRLGILQSLAVGAPAASAFARLFQFGMRHGMLPYTLGAAWWGAECGPFWGHNAVVRIAPFAAHCRLPPLRGGGAVLSHDQVEAVLMRRAGYEVRVLPIEEGSFEDNPPTLLDHLTRDARWCRGNLQYLRLPAMPGLAPMSRFQLAWAVLMFPQPAGPDPRPPAPALARRDASRPATGAAALYLTWLLLSLARSSPATPPCWRIARPGRPMAGECASSPDGGRNRGLLPPARRLVGAAHRGDDRARRRSGRSLDGAREGRAGLRWARRSALSAASRCSASSSAAHSRRSRRRCWPGACRSPSAACWRCRSASSPRRRRRAVPCEGRALREPGRRSLRPGRSRGSRPAARRFPCRDRVSRKPGLTRPGREMSSGGDPGEALGLVPGAGLGQRRNEHARKARPLGLDHRPVDGHRPAAGRQARHDEVGLCRAWSDPSVKNGRSPQSR